MSSQPVVRLGLGDYDHTRDLWTGQVTVPACELACTVLPTPEEIFARFLDGGEWDAAEMSLATVTALRGKGDESLVVLPVFPARAFRHGAVFVRADGPAEPADLNGKRIGVPVWTQTAGVYVRGLLASEFGLDLASVRWVQAGVDEPGRKEPVELGPLPYDITAAPDSSLDRLLLEGEADAVISARPPACVEQGDPRVKRLFPRWTFDEMAYARDSGVFPIMHVLVLRREVYDAHPAVADALVEAFTRAKDRSLDRARRTTVPSYPLPWSAAHAQRAVDVLGEDFWPYGLDANRHTLEVFLRYCAEQRITPRPLTVDELFARERATTADATEGADR